MNCKFIQVITIIVLGFNSCRYCSAQAACNGVLTGTFNNGVTCVGGSDCTLDGATIIGNVICQTGTLLAAGNSLITGSVVLDDQVTRAELDAVTVLGAVQVTDADVLTELVITELANVGAVTVTNAPNTKVRVSGTLQGLDLNNSGDLIANNLMTNATVSIKGTTALVDICGSFLGGLLVEQHTGNIEINANTLSCDQTIINGGLSATKGSGQVRVIGATLPNGDFIVSEYTGDIILQDIPSVSDLKSERIIGSLTVTNVTADSDTIIFGQVGNIALQDLNFNGDFIATGVDGNIAIQELNTAGDFIIIGINGAVILQDSTFALEDISIVLVTETVEILRNSDLSLSVEEINGEVTVTDNTITNGKINKNTGGVVINNNVFTSLSCTDNVPAPIGSNNIITFGDGQCSSGL